MLHFGAFAVLFRFWRLSSDAKRAVDLEGVIDKLVTVAQAHLAVDFS